MSSINPTQVIAATRGIVRTGGGIQVQAFAIPNHLCPTGQHLYPRHCLKPYDPVFHDTESYDNKTYITQESLHTEEKLRAVYFVDTPDDGSQFCFDNPAHQDEYIRLKRTLNLYNNERSSESLSGQTKYAERVVTLLEVKAPEDDTYKYIVIVVGGQIEYQNFIEAGFEFLDKFQSVEVALSAFPDYNILGMQAI